MIHCLHAEFGLACLHRGIYLMDLVFSNKVPYRWVWYEEFYCKCPPFTGFFGNKLLRKNSFEDKGKLYPDLLLLIRREDVYDTVYRLHS